MKKIIFGAVALMCSISAFAESPNLKCGEMLIPSQLLTGLNRPVCIANKALNSTNDSKPVDQSYVSGGAPGGGLEIRIFEDDHSSFPGHETESVKQVGTFSSKSTTASTTPEYAFRQVCGLSLFTGKILNQDEGIIFFDTNTVLRVKRSTQEIRTIYSDYDPNAGYTCIGYEPSVDAYDTKIATLVASLNDTVLSPAGIHTKDLFNASIYKKMGLQIHQTGWKNGYSCEELISGGFNVWDIKLFRSGPETGFYNLSHRDFRSLVDFGCLRSFMMSVLSPVQKRWLYSPDEPKSHGLKELKALGLTISDLQDVMDAKYNGTSFQWNASDFKEAGYTLEEMYNFWNKHSWGEPYQKLFSLIDLKNAGFSAKNFTKNGYFSLQKLRLEKVFSGQELVKECFTCNELKEAGYNRFQRKGCN